MMSPAGIKKVSVYTIEFCPYCVCAKQLLRSKGVVFEEIDITNNEKMWDELEEKSNMKTVPQIFVDDKLIGGYEELVQFYKEGGVI